MTNARACGLSAPPSEGSGVAATINGRQVPLQQLADECLARYGKEVLDGEINRLVLLQELQNMFHQFQGMFHL